jgi:hypothetical protein
MRFLSRLRRRTPVEYFDCDQFDRVARIVGVRLAGRARYGLKPRVAAKAFTDCKNRTVRFDEEWFLGLSPKARDALFVHEIWHITTAGKARIARLVYRLYLFIALPLLSIAAVGLVALLTSPLTNNVSIIPDLFVLLFPFFVFLGFPYGMRLLYWPIEYECDAAAVRFIGLDSTREFLQTLKLKSGRTTHPPTKKRLERAVRVASKFPNPVIDFDSLEGETRQALVFR